MARGLRHLRFECTRCGHCCRRFRVPLTTHDLKRLLTTTQRPMQEWVEWLSPDQVDMTGEPESFVNLPAGRRLLVLSWQNGACSFLRDDLCSVHPERPRSCRSYPFDVTWGARAGIRRLRLLDTTGCEHTWGAAVAQREVSQEARAQNAELQQYVQQVIAFNRLQGHRARLAKPLLSATEFFAWLGVVQP